MRWPRVSALPRIAVDGFSFHEGFETRAKAEAEDAARMRSIQRLLDDPERPRHLSGPRLEHLLKHISEASSPASSVYMRKPRKRFIPQMFQLVAATRCRAKAFTVIPPGWECLAGELHRLNAKSLREAFRQMVGYHSQGWMVAGLHGEFEPTRSVYQLHVHGIACGEFLGAIDSLRSKPSFQVQRDEAGNKAIAQPVRITRNLIGNPSSPLGYVMQSFWPQRARIVDASGKVKRVRQKHRIASPYHEEVLLWLDRCRLSDLIIFRGVVLEDQRLVLMPGIHTNVSGNHPI